MAERDQRYPPERRVETNVSRSAFDQIPPPQLEKRIRFRHQCHTVKIDGPSLREPQA